MECARLHRVISRKWQNKKRKTRFGGTLGTLLPRLLPGRALSRVPAAVRARTLKQSVAQFHRMLCVAIYNRGSTIKVQIGSKKNRFLHDQVGNRPILVAIY